MWHMKNPKDYFDDYGEAEWRRLVKDPYHRLEFEVTMHFLRKYLPKTGLILDAGGGPGRYTIELAKMGYQVVLLDISPVQLDIARREIGKQRQEIGDRVVDIIEGSVADLSRFDDESFDSVLCLDPLSHIVEEEERKKATRELVRVLKRSSPIFAMGIGRYGVYRTVLQSYPGELTDPRHETVFTEGVHRGHGTIRKDGKDFKKDAVFPDTYFFLPDEIPKLFEEFGVQKLQLASCEGLSAHLKEETNSLYDDKEKWEKWFQMVLDTCTDPSIVGVGEHLLFIGRKE